MNHSVIMIAAADPILFEHLMEQNGLKVHKRDTDPLRNTVQAESIRAIASMITEDIHTRAILDSTRQRLKTIAEKMGYLVETLQDEDHDN